MALPRGSSCVCVAASPPSAAAGPRRFGGGARRLAPGAWRLAPAVAAWQASETGGLAGKRDCVGEKRRLTRERLREADARGGQSGGQGFADLGWAFQIQVDITFAGLWAVNSGYSEFVKMGYPDLIREMQKRSG